MRLVDGPRFLALFPSALLTSLTLMAAVQSAVTRLGSRRGAGDLRLDAFQAAYLAGGRRRVVDATIAGLAMSGRLPVDRRGRGAGLTIMPVALSVPLFWVLFGRSSPHHRPTPLGRAVLRRLEKRYRVDDIDHERYLGQGAVEPWDPVAAVGVLGFAAVPSPGLRAALIRSRGH